MYKAVIFDMDGVITDTEKLYRRFQYETGEEYGIPRERMTPVLEHIAGGNRYTNKEVFRSFIGDSPEYFEFRERMLQKLDAFIAENGVELKAGVIKTLTALKEKGLKIGLATSTDRERALPKLKQHDLEKYFDALMFGADLPAGHGKPNPDIYLAACEKLGVDPAEAIGVEDSKNGVQAVKRAGMYCVMVIDLIPPDADTEPYTDKVYHQMDEMLELWS